MKSGVVFKQIRGDLTVGDLIELRARRLNSSARVREHLWAQNSMWVCFDVW